MSAIWVSKWRRNRLTPFCDKWVKPAKTLNLAFKKVMAFGNVDIYCKFQVILFSPHSVITLSHGTHVTRFK